MTIDINNYFCKRTPTLKNLRNDLCMNRFSYSNVFWGENVSKPCYFKGNHFSVSPLQGINGITARSLENKVKRLKEERSAVALRFRKFHDIRKSVKEEVERRFVLRLKGRGTSVKMIKGREQPLKRPKSSQSQKLTKLLAL